MNKVLQVLVFLPALLFIVTGLRWLVAPAGVAPEFGLILADGLGRSTMIGDLSAFFLTTGLCMMLGLFTGTRLWFYPAIMLLGITAVGRILAFLIHDASFAVPQIVVEVIVSILLLVASRRLPESS